MHKSAGNMVTIDEFLRSHPADVMRLIVLSSHYRSPLTFNDDVIESNQRALDRLLSAKRPAIPGSQGAPAEQLEALSQQEQTTRQAFIDSMDEDFNTAGALGTIFELVRAINQARDKSATVEELASAQQTFIALTGVLGLQLEEQQRAGSSADAFIELLLDLRQELREARNYALADRIRDQLAELGVAIEDGPQGSTWHWE